MNETEIKIEKGIPLPTKGTGKENSMTATFRAMKKGDSFQIPVTPYKMNSIYSIARQCSVKITARRVSDGVYRVWRKA